MNKDMLATIFTMQCNLQTRLGYEVSTMPQPERTAYIKTHAQHLDHEIHEMLQELPFFKEWKRYPEDEKSMALAMEKARKEFVDALHFFLNIALALGFTPGDLYAYYCEKNQINHERQDNTRKYKPCVE
jgi:dimeric dUTPase (all-alpha-NTP-PPase superfamily)